MHHLPVSRVKFNRPHPPRGIERQRHDEIAINVLPLGRQRVGLRHLRDHVGLAELPAFFPWSRDRCIRRFSLRRPFLHPAPDELNLLIAQPPLIRELANAMFRKPRRHVAGLCYLGDLCRVFFHIVISE